MHTVKFKVLLVEDDQGQARRFRNLFQSNKKYKFSMIHKASLELGLRYLSKNSVDVILLDLSLPDGSGP